MMMVTANDHLGLRGCRGQHGQKRASPLVVGGDQQVVADHGQRSTNRPAFDRTEPQRQKQLIPRALAETLDTDLGTV